jgi:hypothetical protein
MSETSLGSNVSYKCGEEITDESHRFKDKHREQKQHQKKIKKQRRTSQC